MATTTLPPGYYWGPKLQTPGQLINLGGQSWPALQPGYYDFATMPVGDNLSIAKDSAITQVVLDKACDVSIMPRFRYNEPSCGFVIVKRGPYPDATTPEANRGVWKLNGIGSGLVRGRVFAPIYAHSGARYGRYNVNGYPWVGEGFFPSIDDPWWNNNAAPVGPKLFWKNEREPVVPAAQGPDITVLSAVENRNVYVSITFVDMFGRETSPSTPLMIPAIPNGGNRWITAGRNYPALMGTCGVYVYAGYSPDTMTRQPVLDYIGSQNKYLWPLWLNQYLLHKIENTGIYPVAPPPYGVGSVINWPQKQIVDKKKVIVYAQDNYDLYCPIILDYDYQNFGRILGNANKNCTFTHKSTFIDGRPLQTDIPMVLFQNQKDRLCDATFISNTALVGVAFSDFSGGQAFSPEIERCKFFLYGQETCGILVDECSSVWNGNHTASEARIKNSWFTATIPVKMEGNQTAKNRFTEMCEFWGTGLTRYPADTAVFYLGSPNDFDFMEVAGLGGTFRSIVTMVGYSGQPRFTLSEFFIDQGCPVYVTFSSYQGGTAQFLGGERINTHSQTWARMAEAPHALNANVVFDGVRIIDQTSSIGFNLNQLSIYSDNPFVEVVAPSEEYWLSKGMGLEYPAPGATDNGAYYDFRRKRTSRYAMGYTDLPNSILVTLPSATTKVDGVFNKVKSFLFGRK